MSDFPEYKIKSISDFLSVPPERREACLKEFLQYLAIAEEFKDYAPLVTFVWTDDGIEKFTGITLEL